MERPDPSAESGDSDRAITVVRVLARLNVGGPAIHTVLLTAGLNDDRYRSVLVTGTPGRDEGDMSYFAAEHRVTPVVIPEIGRELSWRDDLVALVRLIRLLRKLRPHIVHTHTAKAGAVGRAAALLAGVPIRVHTFHGHVFAGYFGPWKSRVFVWIERLLGRWTHRIVAISERQKRELCNVYRVAREDRCVVIPLGFDLQRFVEADRERGRVRAELGLGERVLLAGIVGRLVPIKNHDLFLDAAARILESRGDVAFLVVGDGELRGALERAAAARRLSSHVHFLGWRRDLEAVYADLDLVLLTSRNEGTPVALIEAMAAGRAVVATDVGGVRDVVEHGETGFVVPSGDLEGLVGASLRLLGEPALRDCFGARGRQRAVGRYGAGRLVGDVRHLYEELLRDGRPAARAATGRVGSDPGRRGRPE